MHSQQLPTLQESHTRMNDAFRRLGLSESAAQSAAQGRHSTPLNDDAAQVLRETQASGNDAMLTEADQRRIEEAAQRLYGDTAAAKHFVEGRREKVLL